MAKIATITAREILDLRRNPTVEVAITVDDRTSVVASCPRGTSVGKYEAREIRDNDIKHFQGLGVLTAVQNINTIIAPHLQGLDASDQKQIDKKLIELDGTPTKVKLGANALLPVSMAVAKAGAKTNGIPLYVHLRSLTGNEQGGVKIPTPAFNLINGGRHAANGLDIQEFLVIPGSYKSFSQALEIGFNVYKNIKKTLEKSYLSTLIGDEGGFAPQLAINQDALSLISQAIDISTLRLGYDVFLGIDAASNNFMDESKYKLKDRATIMNGSDLSTYYQELIQKYHLIYIEDPFGEDDWDGWKRMSEVCGKKIQLVGDDLFVTNVKRLKEGIDKGIANSILVKVNQIGTLTETIAAVKLAHTNGYTSVMSHRSGETEDHTIADLAVALHCGQIKTGAPSRSDRVAKYNQLLRIEEMLGAKAAFGGKGFKFIKA